ncbi:MAG TPA: DmsC/YnfH family molybdoenzyme membrane anchor subunit [Casimicrobiaceae bacterium]|jgi:DMSO reductase anchor subunit|nr:DmsC/YnfH family molybdoenzyme membrane anchor subunit [Casimicrobiaceae bacterium]
MKPALSIVFFTVASGAGLGLLALLALADLCPVPLLAPAALPRGIGLALMLIAAGLASSVLHLAKPANAWRAFARFRTSWLSREAVLAALLFPLAFAYLIAVSLDSDGLARAWLAIAVCLLAWGLLFCTAMIYASLKPIRQWRTGWTPAAYLLLGHWSAALIAVALATGYGGEAASWAWLAAVLGVSALVVKLGYWRHGAADRGGKSVLTLEQAIGVPQGVRPPGVSVAQARLFDAGHTQRTFLTDEFVFRIARQHAQAVRGAALALGFGIPLIWLVTGPRHWAAAASVAVLAIVGLLAERWLFFADARHTVRLYHGDART